MEPTGPESSSRPRALSCWEASRFATAAAAAAAAIAAAAALTAASWRRGSCHQFHAMIPPFCSETRRLQGGRPRPLLPQLPLLQPRLLAGPIATSARPEQRGNPRLSQHPAHSRSRASSLEAALEKLPLLQQESPAWACPPQKAWLTATHRARNVGLPRGLTGISRAQASRELARP